MKKKIKIAFIFLFATNNLLPFHFANAATEIATSSDGSAASLCNQEVGTISNVSVIRYGNDCIITFTGSSTWTVTNAVNSISYLAVGGGGGGGGGVNNNHAGGGGGAGGYLESTLSVSRSTYTIVVGSGGGGGAAGGYGAGSVGNASHIIDSTSTVLVNAKGGGGGAAFYSDGTVPVGGAGSGGGGAVSSSFKAGKDGTVGQGFKGGSGSSVTFGYNSGGGGGAGGVGEDGVDGQVCAAGGIGIQSSISGTPVTRALGGKGGNGSSCSSTAAVANSGSGGKGGNTNVVGAAGASGIVIIRFSIANTLSSTTALSVSNATYRINTTISATVSPTSGGTITFYQNGKKISTCIKLSVISGTATCGWRPSTHGMAILTALFTPADSVYNSSTNSSISLLVTKRSATR